MSSLISTFILTYILIRICKFEIFGFIIAIFFQFFFQVVTLLLLIKYKIPNEFLPFPGVKKILRFKKVLVMFCLKYSFAIGIEYISFELISFILVFTRRYKNNLLLWGSVCQIINIVYYIGYAIGCHIRNIGGAFLGMKRFKDYKKFLLDSVLYLVFIYSILTSFCIFFSNGIAKLFVNEQNDIETLSLCVKIISLFFYF